MPAFHIDEFCISNSFWKFFSFLNDIKLCALNSQIIDFFFIKTKLLRIQNDLFEKMSAILSFPHISQNCIICHSESIKNEVQSVSSHFFFTEQNEILNLNS